MWDELFVDHPHAVGETYLEHQRRAFWFAGQLIKAGLGCAVHALIPGLCVRSGSDVVVLLHEEMTRRRAAAISGALAHGPAE